jgi:hypothetical protein
MVCAEKPIWVRAVGIRSVEDIGNGMGLRLKWGQALPADYTKDIHYNIYYSTTRFGVFDEGPKAVTTSQSVVVNAFDPGVLQYVAVRATSFDPDDFDISEMGQIGVAVYQYPSEQTLQDTIPDAYGTVVTVEDATDYPSKGFLKVGSEVMKYTSKDDENFYIEDTNRGSYSTFIEAHYPGESVTLWHGIEDENTIINTDTAAWHEVRGTPRNVDEIGEYNVDEDGYRAVNDDFITPDMTESDAANENFPSYDYTGYHRPSIQDTITGECVGSYVGGEFNGGRGLFLQERNLARLDSMLQVTGEPVILLRRKWQGRRCSCMGLRRGHQRTRCPTCFGTGFYGGYDRYINTRPISEITRNVNGFIMVRITPYKDDLDLSSDQGLNHPSELSGWTLSIPSVKDRDLLIRFYKDENGNFIEEYRYEVLSVTRNVLFMGNTGKQDFVMRRMDRTDVLYQFDIGLGG